MNKEYFVCKKCSHTMAKEFLEIVLKIGIRNIVKIVILPW